MCAAHDVEKERRAPIRAREDHLVVDGLSVVVGEAHEAAVPREEGGMRVAAQAPHHVEQEASGHVADQAGATGNLVGWPLPTPVEPEPDHLATAHAPAAEGPDALPVTGGEEVERPAERQRARLTVWKRVRRRGRAVVAVPARNEESVLAERQHLNAALASRGKSHHAFNRSGTDVQEERRRSVRNEQA
jgi:hypothetical protein